MSFLKRFLPLIALLAITIVSSLSILFLGQAALNKPEENPELARRGGILHCMRNDQTFALSEAYPSAWDRVQFVPSWEALSAEEQMQLFDFSKQAELQQHPLMLLWSGSELLEACPMPIDRPGLPRFENADGDSSFSLSRHDANFLCRFIEQQESGYYLCTALDPV